MDPDPWTWDDVLDDDYQVPELPPEPGLATFRERTEISAMLREKAKRKKEALRLYSPYPEQQEFHASQAIYRLVRGGNRGGKTLAVAVDVARALTRSDPFGRYPKSGRAIIVGKDLLDAGKVVYRKLFKPGAFKIIRDVTTRQWRTYNPLADLDRKPEAEDAPPLIPTRFYDPKRISWEDKKEEIPRTIPLYTGWEMTLFSGKAEPPQGWDVDLAWLDEEIANNRWFTELIPRLVDRRGRLIWSATAQVGTAHLFELSQRAEAIKAHGDENPRVTEHYVNIITNVYIEEQDRNHFLEDMKAIGDEEYEVRGLGHFAIHGRRIYPEFSERGPHHIDTFLIPEDWTRYGFFDPGRQVAAGLFIAIPPPHALECDRPVVYNEIYIRKCNAMKFAEIVKGTIGEDWIYQWILDSHEGRKHDTGSGITVEEQYSTELIRVGCRENGFRGFAWAVDDIDAGIMAAKSKLQLRGGRPDWLWMTEKLKWFCWEIKRFMDKRDASTGIISDRPLGGEDHLMDCFRYGASHPMRWHKRPPRGPRKNFVLEYLEKKKKRKRQEDGVGEGVKLW